MSIHKIIMIICMISYTALHTSPLRPAMDFNDGNFIMWFVGGVICVAVALNQCK